MNTRLFFQHQSVGANVLTGLDELARTGAAIPTIAQLPDSPADIPSGQLLHSRAGRNGDGASKLHAFADACRRVAGHSEFAMLKFCYVDVVGFDHAQTLHRAYIQTLSDLRIRHPGLKLAHCTVPLRQLPSGPYALARRMLGHRHPEFARNQAREWFNEQLRAMQASEPLFDLAALESADENGRRPSQLLDPDRTPGLLSAYTDDGGHLNKVGRCKVALAFLSFFNSLTCRK
jgi:hypothetical protein